MDKVITIYEGDEHRAKMEKQFSKTDIFADVYRKAYKLVSQIENEMESYTEINKNRLARYQGMGNNLVIFCGGRGQGKTSAMQSFAKCLDGSYENERNIEEQEMLEFVKDINHNRYEVVDSIDPSAMENGESILRVLISRLFFKMEEYVKSDACSSKEDKEFIKNKKDIIKLFENCYANIEYIKSGRRVNCEQDDLQMLSQMGSSAKLKENLHDLIDKYLTMMSDRSKHDKDERRYLVIPIDDADLATKSLFRLCEDIRNYLSIPNVIILMAVDYEQLVHATYQRYLKQYKVMRKADASKKHETDINEEYHKMAAKYLEKVFPIVHRIDLPQIDNLLTEDYMNIRFEYLYLNKKEYVPVFEDIEPDGNIQKQLEKILYTRTGLIFLAKNQRLHFFMPHTLRELTHWLKMLHNMHEINCDADVYQEYQKTEGMTDELERKISQLQENIQTVRQYFMSYWCEKYLNISAARKFQKLDNNAIKRMAGNNNAVDNTWQKAPSAAKMIFQQVSYDDALDRDEYVREAVYIYSTIFMNEWFAAALKSSVQFEEIAGFAKKTVDLSDYFEDINKYRGKYRTVQFDIEAEALREVLYSIDPTIEMCLENFCVVKQDDNMNESVAILSTNEGEEELNQEIETLEFDILRPVLMQLRENMNKGTQADEAQKHIADTDTGNTQFIRMPYLIIARNMVANYDVQEHLQDIISAWYKTINEETKFIPLGEQVMKLYDTICEEKDIPNSNNMRDIYERAVAQNKEIINTFFLCNYENYENYISQIKDELEECCDLVDRSKDAIDKKVAAKDEMKVVDVQKLIEDLLAKLGKVSDKLWSEWDDLQTISYCFGLDEEWDNISEIDDRIDALKEWLQEQKEKADDQLKSIIAQKDTPVKSTPAPKTSKPEQTAGKPEQTEKK